jgi:branched-chain amino acid transport system substrate-binding protein
MKVACVGRAHLASAAFVVAALTITTSATADYRIGFMTDLSGPLSDSYTPIWEGFDLFVKARNSAGGINGEKVQLFTEDDGLNLQKALSLAKKLASQDQVIGVFGLSVSSLHGPVFEEMRRQKMPAVTAFSATADVLPPAKAFSYSTGSFFQIAGEAIGMLTPQTKGKAKGKVVGMTIDTVGGRAALKHNKLAVEKLGYTWEEVVFPVRTVDYTPHAQAVVSKGADIVVGHYGTSQNLGVIPALRKAGFSGPYVIANYGVTEDAIAGAAKASGSADGIFSVTRYASAHDDSVPAIKEIRDAAKKFGMKRDLTQVHVEGWVLGMVMEAAVQKCGKGCTSEKLNTALEQITVDTKGLTGGPIVFSKDDHYGPSYWRMYQWDGGAGKLKAVGDWVKRVGMEFKTD